MLERSSAPLRPVQPADIRAAVEAGNLDRAEHLCILLLDQSPNDGNALNAAGNVAIRLGAHDAALQRFRKACELAPERSDFRLNAAMVLDLTGNTDQAAAEYRAIIAARPDFTPAIERLAKLLFKAHHEDECRDLINRHWDHLQTNPDICCIAATLERLGGDRGKARKLFDLALLQRPGHIDAIVGHAAIAMADHKHQEVIHLLQPLADSMPEHGELNFLLATAYQQAGDKEKAAKQYERVLDDPAHGIDAALALGRIHQSEQRMRQAADAYRRVVEREPGNNAALDGYAEALSTLKDTAALRELIVKVIAAPPMSAAFWNNFAVHVKSAGLVQNAMAMWRIALTLFPNVAQVYFNLANTLNEEKDAAGSVPLARRATVINPGYARAWNLLSVGLCRTGRREEAWVAIQSCLRLDSTMPEAYVNLGVLHRTCGELRLAVEAFRKAIALRQDYAVPHHNIATLLLSEGEIAEGFREFEWRWATPNFPSPKRPFRQPIWRGEDVSESGVIVWMEQGVGDEIMFAYFIQHMERTAKRVLVECDERLVPLFQRSFEKAEVYARRRQLSPVFFERDVRFKVPAGHLCQYFTYDLRQTIRDNWYIGQSPVHRSEGYLKPDPERVKYWRDYLDRIAPGKLKVGFSWRSGMRGLERDPQFMEIHEISRALGPNVAAVNLQYSAQPDELAYFSSPESGLSFIHPEGIDLKADLDDLTALMSALDLVVTAFTSVGQMAGALGLPTWIFYTSSEERVWQQLGSPFIPWHPSIRMFFRKRVEDGWEEVIERLRSGVERLVEAERV